MLDEMYYLGLTIIEEAEYDYDFTCIGGEIMPEYWDEYNHGMALMDTANKLGDIVGYLTYDTVWRDEVEYIQ